MATEFFPQFNPEMSNSVDLAEQYEGCHCVGAPILDHLNNPIAAIWATGPSFSFPQTRFLEIGNFVKEHASRISIKFGHYVSPQAII